eukprot:6490407-Amphidinium_carterae.6
MTPTLRHLQPHLLQWQCVYYSQSPSPHSSLFTVFTTDVASAFLNTPIDEEVIVQPPKEYYHNQPHTRHSMGYILHPNNGKNTSIQSYRNLASQDSRVMGVCLPTNNHQSTS